MDQNKRNKLSLKKKVNVKELVPNPIIIKNDKCKNIATEKALYRLIMEDN